MKRFLTIFLSAVLSVFLVDGASKSSTQATSFKNGPWIMNVDQTSFTVLFRTEKPAMCWVEIAPDDGTAWEKMSRPKFWQDITGRHYTGTDHKIPVTGLEPGHAYRYRIYGMYLKDGHNPYNLKWDGYFRWNTKKNAKEPVVRTFSAKADTCRFTMVNDIHFRDKVYTSLVSGMNRRSDFILLNGDIISHSSSIDSVLVHTINPIAKYAARYPVVYARGNHESRGADWYKLPYFFPTATGEFYYTFRQGPVAFIVLDAGEDKPDSNAEYSGTAAFDGYRQKELQWLKQAVQQKEFVSAPQKVCIIHIPTLSGPNAWYCQQWISDNFAPVLNKAGIKLMLSGHHHKYILSKPGENGCDYTIVVNSNEDRLDCTATSGTIAIKIYGQDGTLKHKIDL